MQELLKEDQALTDYSIIIEPKFSSVLKSISEPQFKCKGGFDIDHICTNKKCKKSSFHCSSKECQCFKSHQFCYRIWFNGCTALIHLKEKFQKTFFEKIYDTDNEVIKKIQESNEKMASHISLGSFEDKYLQILNKIYMKKDWENFLGAEMEDLYCRLTEENQENKNRETQLQKIYETKAISLAEEGIKFKQEIFKAYLNGSLVKDIKADWKPFIDSPLIRTCLTTMYANTLQCYKNKEKFGYCYFDKLDADRAVFQKEHILFLQKELYNAVSAELLFTASEHQFKAAEFHKKCDGVENTLTIARTEYGKTIFAFAAQKWSSGTGNYVNDTSGKSCIILLDSKKKVGLASPGNSIYCNGSYGPTFGSGHDIYLCNDCHLNNSSYCNFPHGYNNGFTNSQMSYTTICGSPSGYNFKVIQYEVFKLSF